jgi:hypothetical protein
VSAKPWIVMTSGAVSLRPRQESLRKAGLSEVEKGTRWGEAALSCHFAQGGRLEDAEGGLSHTVDGRLVLALYALPSVLCELRRL